MLRQQRLAVHGPDQQHVVAQGHVAAQAAAEGMLVAAVKTAIGTDERNLDGVVAQAGEFQNVPQRGAGPLGVADRLADPGHARIARAHCAASVAGALERDGKGACREAADFIERNGAGFRDAARHLHLPCVVGHIGHIEMIEQIVQARRRHVMAQRLQQDAAVAVRELHFLELERALYIRPPLAGFERIDLAHCHS